MPLPSRTVLQGSLNTTSRPLVTNHNFEWMKTKMRIKCVKLQCPICGNLGSTQLFLNKSNQIRYARTRHYSHIDKDSKKPQFTYCKIEKLNALKTLLSNHNIQLNNKPHNGQSGQHNNIDQKLNEINLKSVKSGAGSSARIEHHPPKVGVVGSNPTSPAGDKPGTL